MKFTDHILLLIERSPIIDSVISAHAKYICEELRCDHIFLIDRLDNPQFTEDICGICFKFCFLDPNKYKRK